MNFLLNINRSEKSKHTINASLSFTNIDSKGKTQIFNLNILLFTDVVQAFTFLQYQGQALKIENGNNCGCGEEGGA